MRPKIILDKWIELFNNGDSDNIAELYHEDGVNHQVANEPVIGKMAIKKMFSDEFSTYKMECLVENIFEDGNWAILEWKDPTGLRGCGFFYFLNGKIKLQRGYWDKLSFLKNQNSQQC